MPRVKLFRRSRLQGRTPGGFLPRTPFFPVCVLVLAACLLGWGQLPSQPVFPGSGQDSDADLTAIAALSCAENEIIKRNGAGAWVCAAEGSATGLTSSAVVGKGQLVVGSDGARAMVASTATLGVVRLVGGVLGTAEENDIRARVYAVNTVEFSATPAFALAIGSVQAITLTDNVTSSTTSDHTAGAVVMFKICQDGTGSRTFAWPATVKGGMTIGSTLSRCSAQSFLDDGTNLYATSPGVTNQ